MLIKDQGVEASWGIPRINSKGQKVISAIALEATTAKVPMQLVQTDSGPGINMIATSGLYKLCFPLSPVSSGERVDVMLSGPCSGFYVHASAGTAASATAHTTFTVGHFIFLTDTGHITDGGATWLSSCGICSTLVGSENSAAMGIALSSGEVITLDFMFIEKDFLNQCTS